MTSRGSYANGRLRREEIIRAAGEVFAAHGYRGASLALIADRVGMSAPGLLHHFPTKEHLLVELLTIRQDRDSERVRRLTAANDGSILEALAALAAENARTPDLVRLFCVLAGEAIDEAHPGHRWFVDRYKATREEIATALADEQRRGRIRDDVDVRTIVAQIVAMFDGLQLQWLLDPHAVDMASALSDYLDNLERRLAPDER